MRWVFCADPASTAALGERLGAVARPGTLVALAGPLGAGKTVFARGFARGLGVVGKVQSPTFALLALHEGGRLPLAHIDLYRLGSADELEILGIEEVLRVGAAVVEWADRFPGELPADRLSVEIREDDRAGRPLPPGGRWLSFEASGAQHAVLLEALDA